MAAATTTRGPRFVPGTGEEQQLFARHQQGDRLAREELVRRFMPLARSLARRYDRSSEPFEDLLQVASLGLLKALDRFDPEMGHPFASFAVPTILGEMRRLANERGRAPTVQELAQYLELGQDDVVDALQAIQAYESLSLDAPRPGATDEATSYGDAMGEEDSRYELVELDATVSAVLGRIPQRERQILRMRFVEDLTQTEIATRVGISQMQVSRLLRRSLDQLRALTDTKS
jgi:RNA polymerase sigma-B factor